MSFSVNGGSKIFILPAWIAWLPYFNWGSTACFSFEVWKPNNVWQREEMEAGIAFLEHEEIIPDLCTECRNFSHPLTKFPDPWPPLRIVTKTAAGLVGYPSLKLFCCGWWPDIVNFLNLGREHADANIQLPWCVSYSSVHDCKAGNYMRTRI